MGKKNYHLHGQESSERREGGSGERETGEAAGAAEHHCWLLCC